MIYSRSFCTDAKHIILIRQVQPAEVGNSRVVGGGSRKKHTPLLPEG